MRELRFPAARQRSGLDLDNWGADEASVGEALAKAEQDCERAEQERRAGRDETAQAVQLPAEPTVAGGMGCGPHQERSGR